VIKRSHIRLTVPVDVGYCALLLTVVYLIYYEFFLCYLNANFVRWSGRVTLLRTAFLLVFTQEFLCYKHAAALVSRSMHTQNISFGDVEMPHTQLFRL
jgi:hypothetical protein